jgi:hypothetical protein
VLLRDRHGVLLWPVAVVLSPAVRPGKTRFFIAPAAFCTFPSRALTV